jgi:hypothetical protein
VRPIGLGLKWIRVECTFSRRDEGQSYYNRYNTALLISIVTWVNVRVMIAIHIFINKMIHKIWRNNNDRNQGDRGVATIESDALILSTERGEINRRFDALINSNTCIIHHKSYIMYIYILYIVYRM